MVLWANASPAAPTGTLLPERKRASLGFSSLRNNNIVRIPWPTGCRQGKKVGSEPYPIVSSLNDSTSMRLYRLANLLNLDVALGALGSLTLAASVCHTSMPSAWRLLLPLAVWATYTLDHLLDGARLSPVSTAPRHQIAKRHARPLTMGISLVLLTLCCGGVHLLPKRLLWLSAVLGLSALAHVYAAYADWYPVLPPFSKEGIVAVLYGAGTWGGPLLVTSSPLSRTTFFLLFIFFLIVLLNLGLFQWFEGLQSTPAPPKKHGTSSVLRFLDWTFLMWLAAMVSAFYLLSSTWCRELLLLTCMGGSLWGMRLAPSLFLPDERFRLVGDGVFLLPCLLFVKEIFR